MSPKSIPMPKAALKFLAVLLAFASASAVWGLEDGTQEPARGQSRVAPSGEWIAVPGESPRSLAQLLYPHQPGVQARFIAALAEANPWAGIDASGMQPLVVGTLLQMPDWRLLGARTDTSVRREQAPATRASKASARTVSGDRPEAPTETAAMPRLRLSMNLAAGVEATDQLRQILRLEYRLLTTLNEQLSALTTSPAAPQVPFASEPQIASNPSQQAASIDVPTAPQPRATLAASAPAPTPATESSPAPASPPAPVRIKEVPAPALVADASSDDAAWAYYLGLAAAVLLMIWLVLRRRRVVADEPKDFGMAQTVMLEHPVPAESAAPASVSDKAAESRPASKAPAALSMVPEPELAGVNPVMELAEIMLSFGRLQGAAQTLQEYIEANPKEALQPWVKLLDIYRTGDMHAEFDELAQKLNKNFNVEVQHWTETAAPVPATEDQLPKAMTLEELPHICTQVIARWGLPGCLDYLHQLLRDNRGGQRSGFTLPVVQEILLLIDILAVREAA